MARSRFRHVKISGLLTVVPPREISIYDEACYYGNSIKKVERLRKMVGFYKRRVVDKGVTPSDLAIFAASKLIEGMKLDKSSIDALIFVVQKPDVPQPATAFFIHSKLALPKTCMCFDVNQGCTGWVYGLHIAHSMIESGAFKRILLLTGDTPSANVPIENRQKAPLFGDAASATILDYSEAETSVTYFESGADGDGFEYLLKPAMGERIKFLGNSTEDEGLIKKFKCGDARISCLAMESYMDGLAIFDFTMNRVPMEMRSLMEYAGVGEADIKYLLLHQANKQIVENVARAAGFSPQKVSWTAFENYGNQTMSSIPALICHDLIDFISRNNNERLMCYSFGNGLSWAGCVLTLSEVFCGGIIIFEKPDYFKDRAELIEYWKSKIMGASD